MRRRGWIGLSLATIVQRRDASLRRMNLRAASSMPSPDKQPSSQAHCHMRTSAIRRRSISTPTFGTIHCDTPIRMGTVSKTFALEKRSLHTRRPPLLQVERSITPRDLVRRLAISSVPSGPTERLRLPQIRTSLALVVRRTINKRPMKKRIESTVTGKFEIPTPGGKKDTRVADAVGTNPQTGQAGIVQVVRAKKTGGVPKRETDAATDIEKPGSSPLLFLCDQQHRLDRQSLRCLDKTKSNIWATKYNFICFPTMQAHSLPSLRALRPL